MSVVLAAAGIGSGNVKLLDEFEATFRVLSWIRSVLEAELADAKTPKGQVVIDSSILKKWETLVNTLDTLSAAKVRYDKNAKAVADKMTPEQELEVVRGYLRAMDAKKRERFLSAEIEWHQENR